MSFRQEYKTTFGPSLVVIVIHFAIRTSPREWIRQRTFRLGAYITWRRSRVMDCHAMARGSIPGRNGVFTELHVLRKAQ